MTDKLSAKIAWMKSLIVPENWTDMGLAHFRALLDVVEAAASDENAGVMWAKRLQDALVALAEIPNDD